MDTVYVILFEEEPFCRLRIFYILHLIIAQVWELTLHTTLFYNTKYVEPLLFVHFCIHFVQFFLIFFLIEIKKRTFLHLFQTSEWVLSVSLSKFGSFVQFSILFLLLSQIRILDKNNLSGTSPLNFPDLSNHHLSI